MSAPGIIIAYRLGPGSRYRASLFNKRVLGEFRIEGGRRYRRRGLLDGVPHWKLSRGVIVVHARDRTRILSELQKWTLNVETWPVPLTPRQVRRLTIAYPS